MYSFIQSRKSVRGSKNSKNGSISARTKSLIDFVWLIKGNIYKSFLFIGFSFDDPNLEHILNQIRMELNENIRTHYCFMKKVCQAKGQTDEDFNKDRIKQEVRETELKRFGIQTIFVDEYSEITDILVELEKAVFANNVFISGSAEIYKNEWDEKKADELAFNLSNKLVAKGFRVVSGYGLGIGSSVINGALTEIRRKKYKHLEEHLGLHPFPYDIKDDTEREKAWDIYRKEILKEIGIVVFIFGNKGETTIAQGCLKEFDIAKDKDCIIIPIGSTGGAAKQIYLKLFNEKEKYSYLDEYWEILEKSNDINELVQTVLIIAEKARKVL
ncbi:SIR2 family protein [Dubosiella newyorkensis]|nr:SIR2 family protein [Dubosiella newyorkensis]